MMYKLLLWVAFSMVSTSLYPTDSNNQLVKKNGVEKFENVSFVKYEKRTKMEDGDFLIKTTFFDKKKTSYYGTEMYYSSWDNTFYYSENTFDIKNPELVFKKLEKKFNK